MYWRDWRRYVHSHLERRGLISHDDMSLFRITDDIGVAVDEITQFYRNYHSSRFVGDSLVLRLHRAPKEAELEELNREFRDLLAD